MLPKVWIKIIGSCFFILFFYISDHHNDKRGTTADRPTMENRLRTLAGDNEGEMPKGAWLTAQYEKEKEIRKKEGKELSEEELQALQWKIPPHMSPEELVKYRDPALRWEPTERSGIPAFKKELLPEVL